MLSHTSPASRSRSPVEAVLHPLVSLSQVRNLRSRWIERK
jgi:hypothetical protein